MSSLKLGAEVVRKVGGRSSIYVKTKVGWERKERIVLKMYGIKVNRPCRITFKNGDPLDVSIENLAYTPIVKLCKFCGREMKLGTGKDGYYQTRKFCSKCSIPYMRLNQAGYVTTLCYFCMVECTSHCYWWSRKGVPACRRCYQIEVLQKNNWVNLSNPEREAIREAFWVEYIRLCKRLFSGCAECWKKPDNQDKDQWLVDTQPGAWGKRFCSESCRETHTNKLKSLHESRTKERKCQEQLKSLRVAMGKARRCLKEKETPDQEVLRSLAEEFQRLTNLPV